MNILNENNRKIFDFKTWWC